MDAQAWDERYAASELVWSAGPNQFVAAELADLPPGRALDLAAGEGRNAIWLARHGWVVTAADFSQVALDKGRRLAGDTPVRWVCADATRWDERSAYDLVMVAYLQLPAAERAAALRAAYHALWPGGTLLVVDFAAHEREELRERDAHIRLGFDDEVMAGWFASAGLKIDQVRHLEGGELTVTLWRGVKAALPQRRAA